MLYYLVQSIIVYSVFAYLLYSTSSKVSTSEAELAVFNGDTGKLTFVSGLPATDKITDFGKMPYVEGGYIYMPVMTSDDYPAIYKIDPATATATKGLSVEVSTVTAVGKIKE